MSFESFLGLCRSVRLGGNSPAFGFRPDIGSYGAKNIQEILSLRLWRAGHFSIERPVRFRLLVRALNPFGILGSIGSRRSSSSSSNRTMPTSTQS